MNFLEKDLETIIWESNNEDLQKKHLPIKGKKFRQLKIGNYGFLDLMTVERKSFWCNVLHQKTPFLRITVYELKKEKVGIAAFLQAVKYCRGIKTFLEKKKPNIAFRPHIVLIAKQVDQQSDFVYLTDLLNHKYSDDLNVINSVENYSFNYDINGISFIKHQENDLVLKGF